MKKLFIAVFIIPFSCYTQVTLDWLRPVVGTGIATDATDNVYTVNWTAVAAGDIILTKHDAAGNFIWNASFNNTDATRYEIATSVLTDNENNIIITGTIKSGIALPVNAASIVMKFDPAGNLLWRNVYETSSDGSFTVKGVIDGSNNIYVLGMGTGVPGFVAKVKKFAPDGTAGWSYFNATGMGPVNNFKLTPDNKLLLIGRSMIYGTCSYVKIDLDGNQIWSYTGVPSPTVGDAAGDSFGNTYLINGEVGGIPSGCYLTKLSTTGTVIWDVFSTLVGSKVVVGTDDNPVIGGFPFFGLFGVGMEKYTLYGTLMWQNTEADGPEDTLFYHNTMKLDAANNVYYSASTLSEMAVCKVTNDGVFDWIAKCSGGSVKGLELGNDNSIYVVGGALAHFTQPAIDICEAPEGLFSNHLAATSARVNWVVEPDAIKYEVWYKKTAGGGWKKKSVPGIKNRLNIGSLVCNTNYLWKIKTICDTVGTDIQSAFSPDQFFMTLACREAYFEDDADLLIFPNPATNQIEISLPMNGACMIRIYNLNGELISNSDVVAEDELNYQINLNGWSNGVYILQVYSGETIYTEKFVISN